MVAHFHVVDLSNPLATKLVTSRGNVALILVFFDNIKQFRKYMITFLVFLKLLLLKITFILQVRFQLVY